MLRRGLGLRHGKRPIPEPYEAISVHRLVSDGGDETRDNHSSPHRGWESDRSILSTKSPRNEVMEKRERQGRDHVGAGEGPDTALATLAAKPRACE